MTPEADCNIQYLPQLQAFKSQLKELVSQYRESMSDPGPPPRVAYYMRREHDSYHRIPMVQLIATRKDGKDVEGLFQHLESEFHSSDARIG